MKHREPYMIALMVSIFITLQPFMVAGEQGSCGVESSQQPQAVNLAAFGTVKALFIFIDFKDDAVDRTNPTWPVGVGPNFLNSIVDSTETQNSGIHANVSINKRKFLWLEY